MASTRIISGVGVGSLVQCLRSRDWSPAAPKLLSMARTTERYVYPRKMGHARSRLIRCRRENRVALARLHSRTDHRLCRARNGPAESRASKRGRAGSRRRRNDQLEDEYLMTLHAPLDAPQAIAQSLLAFNVQPGGWVEGPKIKGKIVAPAADWLRVMPSGVNRLDVRLTIRTDDDDLYPRDIRRCPPIQQQRARGQPGQGATSKPTTATSLPCRRLRQRLRNAHGSMPSQVVGKMIALSREAAFRPLFL